MTTPKIQFVDLLRQYQNLKPEMDAAILRAVGRGDFILSGDTREFETEFVAFNQVPFCIGVGDGTDALHLALLALGVGQGDEVIIPKSTFIASALAISNTGAKPVFVDCEPDFYQTDVKAVERALTPRTKSSCRCISTFGPLAPSCGNFPGKLAHAAAWQPVEKVAADVRRLTLISDFGFSSQSHIKCFQPIRLRHIREDSPQSPPVHL
jgi:hypothetical protein